ncbi:hypothetical protein ALC62_06420 [Cyphomyrmex costatus]|uniref:Uncharacterized protein n=1 Tax=Cyphomyrmex costatus TaxID=456900 RepID=A0A195CPI1_9HYME|nr:hypothetical protein ALC62_06420 [Cyphomyrmex costatus]
MKADKNGSYFGTEFLTRLFEHSQHRIPKSTWLSTFRRKIFDQGILKTIVHLHDPLMVRFHENVPLRPDVRNLLLLEHICLPENLHRVHMSGILLLYESYLYIFFHHQYLTSYLARCYTSMLELTLALVALSNVWPLNRIVLSVAAISSTPATSTRKEVIQCH